MPPHFAGPNDADAATSPPPGPLPAPALASAAAPLPSPAPVSGRPLGLGPAPARRAARAAAARVARRAVAVGLAAASLAAAGAQAPGGAQAQAAGPLQAKLPEAYRVVETWAAQPQPRPAGAPIAPAGIDVADDGRVYVVDRAAGVVHVLDADGAGIGLLGGPGAGPGQLRAPTDVAVDGGRAYVTDTGNGRVQVFDAATLGFLVGWPDLGRPGGIAVADGRAYVSDAAAARVTVLDTDGTRRAVWAPGVDGVPELLAPGGLDVAGERVYVADAGAQAVWITDLDGRSQGRLDRTTNNPAYDAPLDVVATGERVWMVSARRLFGYRRFLTTWIAQPGPAIYGGRGLALGPGAGLSVTVDDARAVFAGVLSYPDAGGAGLGTPRRWGGVPAALGALDGPRRLAALGEEAYLLDGPPRLQRWTAGRPTAQLEVGGATDVLAMADGPAVVALRGGDAGAGAAWRLARLAPDGAELVSWDLPGSGAWYVAAAADGVRWAALETARGVLLVHDGAQTRSFELGGTLVDVAVGGADALVADRAAAALRLVGPDGVERARWPAPAGPLRVAAAPGGTRWFALMADGTVWAYAPNGAPRAVFEGAPGGAAVDLSATGDGRVLVVDGGAGRGAEGAAPAGRVVVHAPEPGRAGDAPPAAGDRCALRRDKVAAPAVVSVGDALTVTLTLDGDCPTRPAPLDVVLVVDRSGSMEGPKMTAAQAAAIDFTAELDPALVHVALVSFSADPALDQGLTDDRGALVAAVSRLVAWGGTDIGRALDAAAVELAGPRARPGAEPVVVLMTDGLPDSPRAARIAAEAARAAGVTVFTIGLGGDVDAALLRELAGADDRAFVAPSEADLGRVYAQIARRLATARLLERVTVVDEVPDNMAYEAGSAVPPAAWDGRTLRWTLAEVGAAGLRLSYRLRPRVAGTWPTNVRADADYRDGVGFAGRLAFPVPVVRVLGTRTVYLPFAQQNACPEQRIDVALVVDASSSMLAPVSSAPGAPTKLEVARRAVVDFLSFLHLPGDQAAVIDFHGAARVRQGLTGDRAALERAVAAIGSGAGTRVDRGLAAAVEVLTGPARRAANVPVVIVLTDGWPDGGTRDDALGSAARLRGEVGALLYTVGLGTDLDGGFLVALAGDPARALFVPDADRLYGVYRDIAWSLPCVR